MRPADRGHARPLLAQESAYQPGGPSRQPRSCCWECNNTKGDFQPPNRAGELLHPYFDDLGNDLWLDCEIVNVAGGPAFLFAPTRPASWSDETFQRLCNHFKFFDLGELYASQAANEFENIRHELDEVLTKDDAAGVQKHLERSARSRTNNEPNGWQAAIYRAMAASTTFTPDRLPSGATPVGGQLGTCATARCLRSFVNQASCGRVILEPK